MKTQIIRDGKGRFIKGSKSHTTPHTLIGRKNISKAIKGHHPKHHNPHSELTKRKISDSLRGRKRPIEVVEKIKKKLLKYSDEERRQKAKESSRIHHYERYGLTIKQFQEWCQKLENKCEICGKIPEKLFVDHCHSKNKARGLLCRDCNLGIGFFKDNPELMSNAINYLKDREVK